MADKPSVEQGCYTEHGVSGYGVAVKLSRGEPMGEADIKTMAEQMMLSIATKCMNKGARCIGHIKSHLLTETGSLKADTIGVTHGAFSHGAIKSPVKDIYMAVNSIVQGIKEELVREATLEGIHDVAEGNGFAVDREREHTYFDEFDFRASKQDYIKQLEEQFAREETGGPETDG